MTELYLFALRAPGQCWGHTAGHGQEQPQLILSIVHSALFLEHSPFYYSIFLLAHSREEQACSQEELLCSFIEFICGIIQLCIIQL